MLHLEIGAGHLIEMRFTDGQHFHIVLSTILYNTEAVRLLLPLYCGQIENGHEEMSVLFFARP